ncbi:hypothetical protein [Sphingomonas aerolata]|uniref:hypothetical protein n=1 Tax=Sphingomonas aerolata TaxID=185951 RepID=UPI00208E8F94|nr:hypothetical protein [Sphingomonas aerolata]USQ99530.1 hypothetical protein NEF64_14050 [Sphingomonas aerolata]
MGDLFGGKTTSTSTQTTDSGPSKFQQPYLDTAFNAAQGIYNNKAGTPFYQGNTYAGMNDDAKATLEGLKGYAGSTGLQSAGQLSSLGSSLAGNAGKATAALDQFSALAGTDATAANISAATAYANNPHLDAQIDANSRDVVRNLNEQTLPGIDRQASAGGGINSSRAGVAAGIATRGAQDRVADISATMRGQAYSQGLNLAQGDRAQTLGALSTAANGYGSLAGQGISALGAGTQAAYGAFGAMAGADQSMQGDRQGQLDADYAKWQGEDNRGTDLLSKYYGIIGNNSWGSSGTSTGTQTQQQSQGLLTGLAGIASTGLGIAGGLGWKPFK